MRPSAILRISFALASVVTILPLLSRAVTWFLNNAFLWPAVLPSFLYFAILIIPPKSFRSAAPIAKPHLRAYCGCRRALLMSRCSSDVYARLQDHANMVSMSGQYMAEPEYHIWLCIFGLINQMLLPRSSVLPAGYLLPAPIRRRGLIQD